ncbi:MAG: hypothetical protein JWL91_1403, partial [Sphingomonas bacterium]|nr:hypothetical protein [Sphingomonas bacterium]
DSDWRGGGFPADALVRAPDTDAGV